jgi:hypothetical protein
MCQNVGYDFVLYYVCTSHSPRVLVVYRRKDTNSNKSDKLGRIVSSHLWYEMCRSDSVGLYLIVLNVNTGNVRKVE